MLQLHSLHIAALKIDRTVTAQLHHEENGDTYCMAILSMAHVLGMHVIAEGVETTEQLRTLQELSCNEVQGYAISPPVAMDQVPSLLRKRFLLPAINCPHGKADPAQACPDSGYA